MVEGLAVTGDKEGAKEQIKALYRTFEECDCTMVEVRLTCCRSVAVWSRNNELQPAYSGYLARDTERSLLPFRRGDTLRPA